MIKGNLYSGYKELEMNVLWRVEREGRYLNLMLKKKVIVELFGMLVSLIF